MDWIDPRKIAATTAEISVSDRKAKNRGGKDKGKPRRAKSKGLSIQVHAALAQPCDVWSSAFDHAISQVRWPAGCSADATFLWSAVIQEQAEVLVRAGRPAKKLASLLAERRAETEEDKARQLSDVLGLLEQPLESLAFQWLDSADAYARSALGVAALAWSLPQHARRPGNEWVAQWLQALVDRVATYTADEDAAVISHLVLHCEMPLLVGVATSASKRTLLTEASKAMDNLAEYLERSEDEPAPWLMHGATYLRAALASVLRCRVLATALGLRKWYPPQQQALASLLTHAARWSRADGTQLLAAGNTAPKANAIWDALAKQTRAPQGMRSVMSLNMLGSLLTTGQRSHSAMRKSIANHKLPEPTHRSEGAGAVCMQSDWLHKGSRLALDYSDSEICLEALGPKGVPVLAGEWKLQVELDGQAQLQLDEWGELCWFSDDDVDYLEVEAKFGPHAKVQRQVVLFREERLLLLADALLCDQKGAWSLSSHLPLAGDTSFEAAPKTTEGFLTTAGGRCLTLPLYLPEWRRQLTGDGLKVEGDTLVAQNSTLSNRLYLPMLISLDKSHAKRPFTWRRLTVGEDLRIVGHDEAVAFRLQIGTEQWVLYRSLAGAKRRTALGMHTLSDFYAGRFQTEDGDVDTIVAVEATV
jgi:hypothetical protein